MEIDLRPVVRLVKQYRASREHARGPFPLEIWQKLSQMAQVYGTLEVAKHARVDPKTLASHVRKLQSEGPEFIECAATAGPTPSFAATVEVESLAGERLRIQANLTATELTQFFREFLAR